MDEEKLNRRMAALDTLDLTGIAEMVNKDPTTVWQQLQGHPNLPELLRFQFRETVEWLGVQSES